MRRLLGGRLHFQVRKPNSKLLCFRGDLAEPRLQARPAAGHLIAVLLGPTRGTAEGGPDLLPDRVPSRNIGQSLARSPAPGRDAYREVEGLGGEQDVRVIQRIDQRGPLAVELGLDEILDRRPDGGLIERVRPAEEPCEPRHLLAMRVDHILIKDEVPWEAGGLLDRRPRVDLPQSDRLLDRETISFLQRRRHLRRAAHADHVVNGRKDLFPEWERQTGAWVLPAPITRGERSSDEIPRPLAKIRKLGGRLPAGRQGRGLVPVAAQPSQDLVIEIEDRLVLPVTLGIIGPRTQEMLLGPQVDTQQVHQASRHGGPAAMHPEHTDDTPSRRITELIRIRSMRQFPVRRLRDDRPSRGVRSRRFRQAHDV